MTYDPRVASAWALTAWAQIGGGYRAEDLERVHLSFKSVSEAVLAVFTPSP